MRTPARRAVAPAVVPPLTTASGRDGEPDPMRNEQWSRGALKLPDARGKAEGDTED
ncbi:hypothetical protein [Streptomyces venezuelae]|uniref:hypothetical protein n=1 Tax=Streptomyces venezuelae TaxID=54571 RepID=UPI001687A063|nr:hypothetical protein [Streptomyces venezuelae]